MYTQQELRSLDRNYFDVIVANDYDITLLSKNTRHMWQLHSVELPDGPLIVLFHKHHVGDDYHLQKRFSGDLNRVIRSIKSHDQFQLNGRRPVKKRH